MNKKERGLGNNNGRTMAETKEHAAGTSLAQSNGANSIHHLLFQLLWWLFRCCLFHHQTIWCFKADRVFRLELDHLRWRRVGLTSQLLPRWRDAYWVKVRNQKIHKNISFLKVCCALRAYRSSLFYREMSACSISLKDRTAGQIQ